VKWAEWTTGQTTWPFGRLVPDEVLYDFGGPTIFTAKIGLEQFLFYKTNEDGDSDYYLATPISPEEISALKEGKLSVRGALSRPKCWLMEIDLDLQVRRYEQHGFELVSDMLPGYGVPLYGSLSTAADTMQQATSPLAFKFFGSELLDGRMPFSTFRNLISNVYDIVRRSLVPASLSNGRDSEFIDFPLLQPAFRSLLIAIDHPTIDVALMKRRHPRRVFDPEILRAESEAEGAKFVEQLERTVDVAASNELTAAFAQDNFALLDNISDIIPDRDGDVSKLQLSSSLSGQQRFVELDRAIGDRIRVAYREARDKPVTISGTIVGMVRRSHTFILRNSYAREITCHVVPAIYDDMLAKGNIIIGRRFQVSGDIQKRDRRDRLKVEGRPVAL
jgi:hypothetical protein